MRDSETENRFQKLISFTQNLDFEKIIIVTFFIFNCFFILSHLTTDFSAINPNDGAKYIESGRQLLIWGLRELSWGPLVAFVYAPIYLLFGNSLNWFMLSAWIGNIILFGLMWFSFLSLARAFKAHLSIPIVLALMFSSKIFITTLLNPSDALFVAMSCFALTKLIQYHKTGEVKKIVWASVFVGFGVLSRVETIILLLPLVISSIAYCRNKKLLVKSIVASILPALLILMSFIAISFIRFGHANLGLGEKSFDSFTHPVNMVLIEGSKNHQAYLSGEPIFGTFQQHQGSVIRAIFINPIAFLERIIINLSTLPKLFMVYFGSDQSLLLFLFSLYGIYAMIRNKDKLLWLLLVWPLHAFVSLIFFPVHIFPQTGYLFLVLTAFGITRFFSENNSLKEQLILFCSIGFLLIISFIFQFKLLFATSLLITIVLLINIMIMLNKERLIRYQNLPAIVLLIGVILFGNDYVFPNRRLGTTEDELAVHFMLQNIPEHANLISFFPKPAVASKLNPQPYPTNIDQVDEFVALLYQKETYAIYVDEQTPFETDLMNRTLDEEPDIFNLVYNSESGNIRIYLISNREYK
jgi:hypothetical protein